MASAASAARPYLFISASGVSLTWQTGTVLTRGRTELRQVSWKELHIPKQFFTSLLKSSARGDIVAGGLVQISQPQFSFHCRQ